MQNIRITNVNRGEVYYANLSPVVGSEQGGYRPVIILQNNIGNKHSPTVIVAAITSKTGKNTLPVHVSIPNDFGLEENSVILLEQIRTIDKFRLECFVGMVDEDVLAKTQKALNISLDINKKPKWDKALELCLCPICAGNFYNSNEHYIKRADYNQTIKDTCTYCNTRQGYDYKILNKENCKIKNAQVENCNPN
jgi:mRNA interferase MazF